MASSQIRVDEDVYAKLKEEKRPDESFSDVIDRLITDWSLAEWGGWMDESTANKSREQLHELGKKDEREREQLLDELHLDVE